jgi:hypothetical protein
LKFITFEEYAAVYTSCINQICDAGITIFREVAFYLFMASINLYYGSAIANVFADTPELLRVSEWTLEAVTRYFGLKRLTKMLTDRDHKKAPERQSRQEQSVTATDSAKQNRPTSQHPKCATCHRWHQGECRGKDWNPNTVKQPEKVAELPTKEPSKGHYTVKSTDTTSI